MARKAGRPRLEGVQTVPFVRCFRRSLSLMDIDDKPFSYGVRQAILLADMRPNQIACRLGISAQGIYRFLKGTRNLSQSTFDEIGKLLDLSLERWVENGLLSGTPLLDRHRNPVPGGTALSDYLRRAVKADRRSVAEIATAIGVSHQQLYRFLDPSPEKSRGLSQEKLDRLCAVLAFVV